MPPHATAGVCARLAIVATGLTFGCQTFFLSQTFAESPGAPVAMRAAAPSTSGPTISDGQQPVLTARRLPPSAVICADGANDPFYGQGELNSEQLVAEVLARNRSLAALQAAWRAAAQRYPQVVSLADPTFMSLMAPGSFNDPNFQSSFMVGASQHIPWPGKRQLRGQAAQAETSAASFDAGDLAVRLAATTRAAFFDYYLARRQQDLVAENVRRLREFRDVARAKYEANEVTQQDILQADVDLAELARQQIELERSANIVTARLNTLMHRLPTTPLPPPPHGLPLPQFLPPPELLYEVALQRRPDLAAIGARVRAEQAQVQLAYKEFLPDFDVGGRYDQFWDRVNQRGQLGINMNVPLYQQKRQAAAREALWRVSQRRAEYEQQIDTIRNDVQVAYERVNESRQVFALYDERILPTIDQNVKAARAAYEAGRLAFLPLIEAQRQAIEGQMKWVEALADYHRRMADLQQAIGGAVPVLALEEVPLRGD
jgi:outer membrane protein, heavy metal efflux system